ncbi:MAG TPA: sulfite exporter TauE/SafE family protein [Solimonas sp.]|nr:sulfite exporter TauE/SafE family protein [Solimonas sp.]
MESLLIYLLTGAIAGLLAGLFGVGGGMVMVPALALVLPRQGVPGDAVMQVAVATSLAVISATAVSSMLSHQRHGAVLWPVFRWMALGLAAGSLGGAFVADQLASRTLGLMVGVGALLVAAQMFFDLRPAAAAPLPGPAALVTAGGIIGLLSALVGIGGGSLTVPFLGWRSVDIRKAVGTSAACGLPIAWAGALGFIVAGWDRTDLPGPQLGYVSLQGFAALALASVLLAPLGARLAHRLPPRQLKRGFAALLTGVGLKMLIG